MNIFLNQKKHRGYIGVIIACVVVIFLIVLFFVGSAALIAEHKGAGDTGGMLTEENAPGATAVGAKVDCGKANITNMTAEQYQWVKDAASKHLNGDEAALITVIQAESSWIPSSTNNGHATGLGQFMPKTARGFKEFVGGNDGHGGNWPAGNVYDISTGHDNDARFDAKRSIYGAAHLLSGQIARFKTLKEAYEQGYHTYCKENTDECRKQKSEAQGASAKIITQYNNLKSGGGCKETYSQIAIGESNGKCLAVPYIDQKQPRYCGRASQAQLIAFFKGSVPSNFVENNRLSLSVIQKQANSKYVGSSNPDLNQAIRSIQAGYPVIVYTNGIYGNTMDHIFVLTGYNSQTQTFSANDTWGGPQNTCISTLGGKLTKTYLSQHLKTQKSSNRYFILVKP